MKASLYALAAFALSCAPKEDIPKLPEKPAITYYFDPDCDHCDEFGDWMKASQLPERFSSTYTFTKVCVELPAFGQDGRCERAYRQDGKANYHAFFQRCQEAGGEKCGKVPSMFVGKKMLSREEMDDLENVLGGKR